MAQVSRKDVNRLFLQAIISRKYVSVDLAKALWKASTEAVQGAYIFVVGHDIALLTRVVYGRE